MQHELQQDSEHFIYSFIFSVGVSFLQVKFAMKLDLAGTMVWSIDTDDFHGDCISNSGGGSSNYPLMRTISRTITEVLKEKQEHEDRGHTVDQQPSAACKIEAVLWVMAANMVVWHSVLVWGHKLRLGTQNLNWYKKMLSNKYEIQNESCRTQLQMSVLVRVLKFYEARGHCLNKLNFISFVIKRPFSQQCQVAYSSLPEVSLIHSHACAHLCAAMSQAKVTKSKLLHKMQTTAWKWSSVGDTVTAEFSKLHRLQVTSIDQWKYTLYSNAEMRNIGNNYNDVT